MVGQHASSVSVVMTPRRTTFDGQSVSPRVSLNGGRAAGRGGGGFGSGGEGGGNDNGISSARKSATSGQPRPRRRLPPTSRGSKMSGDRGNKRAVVFLPLLLLVVVAFAFYVIGLLHSVRSLPPPDDPDRHDGGVGFLRDGRRQQQHRPGPTGGDGEVAGATLHPPGDGGLHFPLKEGDRSFQHQPFLRGDGDAVDQKRADVISPLPGVNLPESRWPVSISDEAEDFETIVHPADPRTTMRVPKFWSEGGSIMGHDGPLMSREVADRIGTYDTSGGKVEGSPESRTIFVTIASYRDYQCRQTVESVFTRAKYPERIRVAVVDQIEKGVDVPCNEPIVPCRDDPGQALCKWKDRIDVYTMKPKLAVGPVFARHIGHRMYRGEYYAMQIDAHVTFITDWDVDVISQHDATGNEMAVMSNHPSDVAGSIDPKTGRSRRKGRAIMCNTVFTKTHQGEYLLHLSQPERVPSITGTPQLHPYWAAGFSFARGHFVANVPYDPYQPMVFQGEESGIAVRAFTYGYDLYAPERGVCFHTYAMGANKPAREKVPKYWEHSSLYSGAGVAGMKRLLGIIGMIPEKPAESWNHAEEERYGIGNVRSVNKFYETFGIDVHKKVCQKNLCSFVAFGQMHKDFVKHLRRDGMGINYDRIQYKFREDSVPEFSLTDSVK